MERQARRAQVLRHAKRIFARKGYHRTNVADIIARARIARGTFYLYFQNKKELFEELLAQVLTELSRRIQRLRADEPDPVNQLRDNLKRVMNFVLAERELTDILLNHSVGFDRDLDLRILEFYQRIADAIQRSLDLGVQMNLVRPCDTRVAAFCILGGIKEVVGQIARRRLREIDSLVEEILTFGLGGVARPELLEEARRRGELQPPTQAIFGPKLECHVSLCNQSGTKLSRQGKGLCLLRPRRHFGRPQPAPRHGLLHGQPGRMERTRRLSRPSRA